VVLFGLHIYVYIGLKISVFHRNPYFKKGWLQTPTKINKNYIVF
jgi:hypothetical protein